MCYSVHMVESVKPSVLRHMFLVPKHQMICRLLCFTLGLQSSYSLHSHCYATYFLFTQVQSAWHIKVKVVVYRPDIHDYAFSTDFTFPLARWAPMQPATIDRSLDLCTMYPLRLGGLRQCGIPSLPNTCTHNQSDNLAFNALSSWPHAPTSN